MDFLKMFLLHFQNTEAQIHNMDPFLDNLVKNLSFVEHPSQKSFLKILLKPTDKQNY